MAKRNKQQNQDKGKSYLPLIVFITATVLISLFYNSLMNDLTITSNDLEIVSQEFTHVLTAIAIGVVLGGTLAVVTMIYEGLEITGKTYVWVVGIISPGITALVCWIMTGIDFSSLTYKILLMGHIIGLVVSILLFGIAIIIGDVM